MKQFNSRFLSSILLSFLLAAFVGCQPSAPSASAPDPIPGKLPKKDRIDLAMEMEFELTKDPATNTVPRERLYASWAETQRRLQNISTRAGINEIVWEERGPSNVGGRTRAMLLDANDPSGNTMFAGGVSGGLWKTTNIASPTPQWAPVDDLFDNLAVSAIAQDPSNPNIMYFGTGEGWFNADAMRGLGIWKSTDGGQTWNRLASTAIPTFYYCQKLVVDATGAVFVSTSSAGLVRSLDGGNTWTTVLGLGTFSNQSEATDIELASNGDMYVALGIFSQGRVWKSMNRGDTWTQLNAGLPASGYDRVEIASAPSDPNRIYLLLQDGSTNQCEGIYRSNNAGVSFTSVNNPAAIGMSSFTRNQAWYDLICAVDPNDPNTLMIGGVDLLRSTNGGNSWTQVSQWFGGGGLQYVHADQHEILYGSSSIVYFGNDGGVWRSSNGGVTITDRNDAYNITQFYSCAIHPDKDENYFIGGAQDNGTQRVTSATFGPAFEVSGGDGSFAHIDEDEPNIQMSGFTYQNYVITTNNWNSANGAGDGSQNGAFINPTDYDSETNILYCAHRSGNFYRISGIGGGRSEDQIAIAAFGGGTVRHVMVSQNIANRVFFGLSNGRVIRVDNADSPNPVGVQINTAGGPRGSISCVAIENGNDNHLLVTSSNYGTVSVWETFDAGGTWTDKEGDLPDMPVRWAMFSPVNSNTALLATELGVWATEDLAATSVEWIPNATIPNTRVSMLQSRASGTILAGMYGRGFYTTSSLEIPSLEMVNSQILVKEASDAGRFENCEGYTEVMIPIVISSAPAEPVPVLLEFGPSTTVEPEDYRFVPSQLILFPPGVADTQFVTLQIANDGRTEGPEFLEILLNLPVQGRATISDKNKLFVVTNDGLANFSQVATTLDDFDAHDVNRKGNTFFHLENEQIIAKFENLGNHDFGCVSISIDRAGSGASEFQDSYSNRNSLGDKTIFVTADNPSDSTSYRLTFYVTGEEALGWQEATGQDFEATIGLIRSDISISEFSPETPAAGTFDQLETSVVTSGNNFLLTATVNGNQFGGFGFGAPGIPLALAGNDFLFEGEPLEESNRLFWNLTGSFEWAYFDVFEVEEDGTETLLTTVDGLNGVQEYEAFDLVPVVGINRYKLYLQTTDGGFAVSDIVEIEWEDVPDQMFPVTPNPFVDMLNIFPGDENVSYEMNLYNINGQLVASEAFVSDGVFVWSLAEYGIAGGIYFLELTAEGQESEVYKLIKR